MPLLDFNFSDRVLAKAERLLRDHPDEVHRDSTQPLVWWVTPSSMGLEPYRVQTDGRTWVTCTCPNGIRLGVAQCYHAAAVLIRIAQERGERNESRDHQ